MMIPTKLIPDFDDWLNLLDMDAIADDLHRAQRAKVVVLSTQSGGAVPYDARLRVVLGGTLGALNAGVFRLLASRADGHRWDIAKIQDLLDEKMGRAVLPIHDREALDDGGIVARITALLVGAPTTSRTVALRAIRESGVRCEQTRFGRLFEEARLSAGDALTRCRA